MKLFPTLHFRLRSSKLLTKKLGLNIRRKYHLEDLKPRCRWEDNINVGLKLCVKLVASYIVSLGCCKHGLYEAVGESLNISPSVIFSERTLIQ